MKRLGRYALRLLGLSYLFVLLALPIGLIFRRAFQDGFGPAWDAVTTPAAKHALLVTLMIAAIAVPANTIFGIICAIAVVRHRFPGKNLVNAIVDLPLALSPIVVGLAFLLLFGTGGWLEGLPFDVVFALPGMVLATIFVSLPFVVREVVPVLREIGTEQEQAAATLHVEERYQSFDYVGAYAASVLLAMLAIATLVAMTVFRPREQTR